MILALAIQTAYSTELTNGSARFIFSIGGDFSLNLTNDTTTTIWTNAYPTSTNLTNDSANTQYGYYQFINEPPTTPSGLSPDGVIRTSTTINLTITASTDLESDTIYYYWFLDENTNPITPIGMSTNPYLTYEETASGIDYYWKVIASDNITNSTNSSTATFHVAVPTGPSTGGGDGGFLTVLNISNKTNITENETIKLTNLSVFRVVNLERALTGEAVFKKDIFYFAAGIRRGGMVRTNKRISSCASDSIEISCFVLNGERKAYLLINVLNTNNMSQAFRAGVDGKDGRIMLISETGEIDIIVAKIVANNMAYGVPIDKHPIVQFLAKFITFPLSIFPDREKYGFIEEVT